MLIWKIAKKIKTKALEFYKENMENQRLYVFLLFFSIVIVTMVYIFENQLKERITLNDLYIERKTKIDVNNNQDEIIENRVSETTEDILKKLKKNPNDVILKYVNLPYDYKYGSNSIPLAVSALLAEGDFLELGMGKFSTPLLHKIAADKKVKIYSIDTENEWVLKYAFYNRTDNHLVYVN